MGNIAKIKVGDKFDKLTIIDDLGCFVKEGTKYRKHYVKCICECGNECITETYSLTHGKIKSCGCLQKLHLESGRKKHKENEYEIFEDIVFVKFTNCNEYFICDLDDLPKIIKRTWYKNKQGYAASDNNNCRYRLNRFIMKPKDDEYTDHINGYLNDYRKNNLRNISPQKSSYNIGKRNDNTSGYKGIYKDKYSKYETYINVDKKRINLGYFENIYDAINARKEAEIKYFGEYRRV